MPTWSGFGPAAAGNGIWAGGRDSRPANAGRSSPWAGGCCRSHRWAEAAPAARPRASPAPGSSWAARPPGPSTAGRHGCGQRGAVRAQPRQCPTVTRAQGGAGLGPEPELGRAGDRGADQGNSRWGTRGGGRRRLSQLPDPAPASLLLGPSHPAADSNLVTFNGSQVLAGHAQWAFKAISL